MSNDEWKYLLGARPNARSLRGVAQVNGVNGLILLPDNWTVPVGISFKSGLHSKYVADYSEYQSFTADQWLLLEAAGAVFLPAAGYRYGSDVNYVQYLGNYWSATGSISTGAHCLSFYSAEASMGYEFRDYGRSVRLVKDL